jgi:hypothetical protein
VLTPKVRARPDGNRPDDYAAEVAAAAGVSMNTPVGTLDDSRMLKMQNKIRDVEGARSGQCSRATTRICRTRCAQRWRKPFRSQNVYAKFQKL